MDQPSPMTSSVTPWRISLCDRPSSISDSFDQLIMLMKPGATAKPSASITLGAPAFPTSPTTAMRSPRIATSPTLGGRPLPS